MFPLTPPAGSPTLLPNAARPRSAAPTRSTSFMGHRCPRCRAPPRLERGPGAPAASPNGAGVGPQDAPPRPGPRARRLKSSRYALWKNPEDLTERQTKLAWIAKTDTRLDRAYLLKEGLRHGFSVKGEAGKEALDRWISWARRCRIPVFVELAGRIVDHRDTSTPPSTTDSPMA